MKQAIKFSGMLRAGFNLVAGILLGIVLLEVILRLNPELLIAGMAAPAPVFPRLQLNNYPVYYSDGDLFYIQPGLDRPVPAEGDRLEAQVHYQTDEFGFPNQPPLAKDVDVAVLGRSYSMGAQTSQLWVQQVAGQTGYRVLNLSQSGNTLSIKRAYFQRYAAPRHPKWVVVEVLVPMDIVGGQSDSSWVVGRLPYPLIYSIVRRVAPDPTTVNTAQPVFPILLPVPGRELEYSEFVDYLSTLSIDNETIQASRNWSAQLDQLSQFIQEAQRSHTCVLLLYAPTKSEVYLPLTTNPQLLAPVFPALKPYRLGEDGWLVQDPLLNAGLDGKVLQANALARRQLVESLARALNVPWVDPSEAMRQSTLTGVETFLRYDSHWSPSGHQIVASLVSKALQDTSCP